MQDPQEHDITYLDQTHAWRQQASWRIVALASVRVDGQWEATNWEQICGMFPYCAWLALEGDAERV